MQLNLQLTRCLADTGAWPRFVALSMMDDWTWSFHLYSGHVMGQLVLAAFTVAVALCVVVGHYTRCSSVALWLLTVSLHNRTTSLNNFSGVCPACVVRLRLVSPTCCRSDGAVLPAMGLFSATGRLVLAGRPAQVSAADRSSRQE